MAPLNLAGSSCPFSKTLGQFRKSSL